MWLPSRRRPAANAPIDAAPSLALAPTVKTVARRWGGLAARAANTPTSSGPSMTPIATLYAAIPLSGIFVALFTIEQMVNGVKRGFGHIEADEKRKSL